MAKVYNPATRNDLAEHLELAERKVDEALE